MTQRSALQIQILEKLGAPLLAAACDVVVRQQGGEDQARKQEAEMVAEMMGKAVQASISLSGSMDMKEAGAQGDSIRLALAAMAGQLIAGQCRGAGKIPSENDIKRMVKALEAVLSFSDNFTPAPENAARLEALEAPSPAMDENQINIQYMMAFVPVVNAVAAFSFGRPENRLAQEIADRLVRRAKAIQEKLVNGNLASGGQTDRKMALGLLPGLCRLYAACHQEETAKLMGLDTAARAKMAEASGGLLPMEPVWQSFEVKSAMLEALGSVPAGAGAASVAAALPVREAPVQTPSASPFSSFVAAPVQAEKAPEAPQVEMPAPPSLPQAVPESEAAESAQTGGVYNPMGFFKAKPKTEEEGGQGA